jgi:hypothetical protein
VVHGRDHPDSSLVAFLSILLLLFTGQGNESIRIQAGKYYG